MAGEDIYSELRVASFSCYLKSADENLALNLTGVSDSSSTVISPEETPRVPNLGRIKNTEPEISVFRADRYFNMKTECPNVSTYEVVKEKSLDMHHLEPNFRPKTSRASSEASSFSSQSALLKSLHRNPSQSKHKRGFGMRLFPIFGCKGPCVEKQAVSINETIGYGVVGAVQQSKPGLNKEEQFSFPVKEQQPKEEKVKQEDPRNSIEVFGSLTSKKGDVAVNMDRKLSILTWDAIPKSQSLVTTSFGSSALCDDMASEASSDLFELENISGAGRAAALSRQESCNMSSSMTDPTTLYAPSEASIEWSVVTASAADFLSVVSDYEDKSVMANRKLKDSGPKDVSKSGSRGLLGCRSHKAVRVAESTYRTNEKAL